VSLVARFTRRRRQIRAQRLECRTPFPGYAVIDLETTGFSWADGDRVIEIGVILLDEQGQPTGAWSTLVHPERPVAGTHVHQITDRDVLHAPTFGQVAGLVSASCSGRVLAAHNLAFDSQFLRMEMARAGHPVDLGPTDGLCTARLAQHYLPHASGELEELCYAAGIAVRHRHWALWDAEAAGRLLHSYIAGDWAFGRHWCDRLRRGLAVPWPDLPLGETPLLPRCLPAAGHPADDWCVPDVRQTIQRPPPPLPSGRRRVSASGRF